MAAKRNNKERKKGERECVCVRERGGEDESPGGIRMQPTQTAASPPLPPPTSLSVLSIHNAGE
jgi:hypothetical protein